MQVVIDLLNTCVPTIVGALIVIIPTAINKKMELKQNREEQDFKDKQQRYTKLITLFIKVLRWEKSGKYDNADIDELIGLINTISITGNIEVVEALDKYVKTWGKEGKDDQNKAYSELVKAIRKDLCVDEKDIKNFPEIGLVEVNLQKKLN